MKLHRTLFLALFISAFTFAQKDTFPTDNNTGPSHAGRVVEYADGFFENRMVPNQSEHRGLFTWSYPVTVPHATFVKVYFEDYRLAKGDELVIFDTEGRERQRIGSSGPGGLSGFWSLSVPGDTIILQIESVNDYSQQFAFGISKVFMGESNLGGLPEPNSRSACADPRAEPFRSAWCYSPGQSNDDAAMWQNARGTVAVLTIGNYGTGSWCTGSLVSIQDYVLTNQHCIETATGCQTTEFVFNYYRESCETSIGGIDPIVTQGYYCDFTDNDTFFINPIGQCTPQGLNELDYAFAHVMVNGNSPRPSSIYPLMEMELNHQTIADTTDIYIIGHPEGFARVISEGEMDFTSPFGLHYVCDTRGGSSGSPIFSRDTHKMIGLHHCAGCDSPSERNRGMFLDQVRADIDSRGSFFNSRPRLIFSNVNYTDLGDGDGFFDLGERFTISMEIRNTGNLPSSAGTLTLSTNDPNVIVENGTVSLPALDFATRESTTLEFQVTITQNFTCGDAFTLNILAEYGEYTSSSSVTNRTGEFVPDNTGGSGQAQDTPISIPDNDPAGISSIIQINTGGSNVGDIEEISVDITHTYIGDLQVDLISPAGTRVALHARSGDSADNLVLTYGDGNNGTTVPAGDLSALRGEAADGNWSLFISDNAGNDIGTLNSWSISMSTGTMDCSSSGAAIQVGIAQGEFGQQVAVPINFDDPAAETFSFGIMYDPLKLNYVDYSLGTALGCDVQVTPAGENMLNISIDCSQARKRGDILNLMELNFQVMAVSGDTQIAPVNPGGDAAGSGLSSGMVDLPELNQIDYCQLTMAPWMHYWQRTDRFDEALDMHDNARIDVRDMAERINCPSNEKNIR